MRFWIRILPALLLAFAAQAQSPIDWQTSDSLPGTDLSTLNAVQKQKVLKLLRDHDCSCQCGMKIAGYDAIKEGDVLECYKKVEVKRTLGAPEMAGSRK